MKDFHKLVCSLENSIKLKELKIEQKSLFSWCKPISVKLHGLGSNHFALYINEKNPMHTTIDFPFCSQSVWEYESYAAFTAQELLLLLNGKFITITNGYDADRKSLIVIYEPEKGTDNSYHFEGEHLEDLLAKALIACINEGEFKNENC